jgi:hypothetical protein
MEGVMEVALGPFVPSMIGGRTPYCNTPTAFGLLFFLER